MTATGGSGSVLGSSAVMAAGTVVSRISGFARSALLVAALGASLHADVFNIANTIPNMLYILLAGGVFNAVLVPQLVRALRHEPDGGEAYTNRIITLAAIFLAVVTLVLVVAAPVLMRLFLSGSFNSPDLAAQREAAINFARFCLPQVFFYGMFVLVGQVLNARGRFGPMMWAPIANNVISVVVLVVYLVAFGPARDLCAGGGHPSAALLGGSGSTLGGFSTGRLWVLGLGSTLGIAVQLLVLVPYLRSAGFSYRPRFDFRGSGLGHTLRLGTWTVLFVIVNQIAYTIVVKIASSGTASTAVASCAHSASSTAGTGYTIYSNAFLLVMVPHSIITVSLATAMLPRLSSYAAEGNLAAVGRSVASTLRSTYSLVVPIMALLPVIALEVADLVFGYGAGGRSYRSFVPTLSLFALGIVFFTTHYLMLRGFYALEQTRRVFWIQCVVSVVNIVAAFTLTRGIPASETAPRLVVAYTLSYLVGSVISYALLSGQVGGLDSRRLLRFVIRLAIATAVATALAAAVRYGLVQAMPGAGKLSALLTLVLTGLVDVLVFVVLARTLRIREALQVVEMVTRRSRRTPHSSRP